jgi:hypothetical protein
MLHPFENADNAWGCNIWWGEAPKDLNVFAKRLVSPIARAARLQACRAVISALGSGSARFSI